MNHTEHFDAVIVGSGFGGSAMAYRLAEAGLRVCLLERGKTYPPGSFPRTPYKMKRNFWDPSAGYYGLFNFWSFPGLGALVSSGLGGGSLIYANVLIRKDEKWFVHEDLQNGGYEYWPITRKELDPHYEQAERMLNGQPYPFSYSPYDQTGKTRAMMEAAQSLGWNWHLPNLAVSFRTKPYDPADPDGQQNYPVPGEPIEENPVRGNLHKHTRYTCILCGECDIGCNYGSKNTLDYNYLSEAKRLGAEIRSLAEVRTFEPRQDGQKGYTVNYVVHDLKCEGNKQDTQSINLKKLTCKQLILAAGTFGTTYLLLKNRSAFPLIKNLGSHFSVNGDFLAFIIRCSLPNSKKRRVIDASYGPVITSAIRMDDAVDTGGQPDTSRRGFYIEDGGYPDFFNWIVEMAGLPEFAERTFRFGKRYITGLIGLNADADMGAELAELIGDTETSMSSFPLLSMGRDIPDGKMSLRGKYLEVDWKKDASEEYFDRLRNSVREIARTLKGDYQDNLSWYLSQILTAHPLGGCPMGMNENEGVVSSYGELFQYPGCFIADGSVMPGPVGPNPALTIAALSDRFSNRVIDNHKRGIP